MKARKGWQGRAEISAFFPDGRLHDLMDVRCDPSSRSDKRFVEEVRKGREALGLRVEVVLRSESRP